MPGKGMISLDLAGSGLPEALRRTFVGFQLWHDANLFDRTASQYTRSCSHGSGVGVKAGQVYTKARLLDHPETVRREGVDA
jgi:hypothetical protein